MLSRELVLVPACLVWLAWGGCERSSQDRWHEAQRLWQERDLVPAYRAFAGLDPASEEGREARERLRAAETHYRAAIARLQSGQDGAREELDAGMAIAPMDPRLYLPLARAFRARGLPLRAAAAYRRFLSSTERGASEAGRADPERAAAQQELSQLDPEADAFSVLTAPPPTPGRALASIGAWVAALVLAGALGVAGALVRLRRGTALKRIARERPELHPALVYQLGGLRHELLKHRIGAVADALAARDAAGGLLEEQRRFLFARLYGGEPLLSVWQGHLRGLRLALGLRLDLRRCDQLFYEADRAVRRIARLQVPLQRGGTGALALLRQQQRQLLAFDQELRRLCRGLSRTRVDSAFLAEAVAAVMREVGAPPKIEVGGVEQPEADASPNASIEVEVYRVDLLLVLKNLLRNAVAAVRRGPTPRVALDGWVEVLPTGEELVHLRVRDSAPGCPDFESGAGETGRGLLLVRAALNLYRGGIVMAPATEDGFQKSITVWFFRSQQEAP